MRLLYLFLLVPVVAVFIFQYVPIYGMQIAFKDHQIGRGIWAGEWNNFFHFRMFFESPFFGRVLRNTVILSVLRIVFAFPAPILLALFINEVMSTPLKRTIQSITYLPHFMSWVVLAGIIIEVLSPQRGLVAVAANIFGFQPQSILNNPRTFRPLLIITGIWKEAGWGAIVYLAAIASIDPTLYEAAAMDGAGRFRNALHITLPSLWPIITILLLLRLGSLMQAGFDQVFNLYNPLVYEVADIIDTYEYRVGLIERRYDFSTAVGLFKNVIGLTLVLATNAILRRFSDYGLW